MVDKLAKELDLAVELISWQMPKDAVVPSKPDNYREEGKKFALNLANHLDTALNYESPFAGTRIAHEATKIAKSMGKELEYNSALFNLKWIEGKNISDQELLVETAEEIGLDKETFRSALVSRQGREAVESDFERSVNEKIWTIPSFISGGNVVQIHHFKDMPSFEQFRRYIMSGESFTE